MLIQRIPVGPLYTNCYVIACDKTGEAAVVDPGGDAEDILDFVENNTLVVKYVILTHGHSDHIAGVEHIKAATGAKIAIHSADAPMLTDASKNLSQNVFGKRLNLPEADIILKDGDILKMGLFDIDIIHTPGHTQGGICLSVENILITGDTLFACSVGRSDLPGGNHEQLISSIKEKLLKFTDDVKVFPGHGPVTTIGIERSTNNFIR
jgi:hydroxyacylglutathione hydrolase